MRGIAHLFIFIPYYGNVGDHVRHLFYPWKRIVITKETWYERLIANLFSVFLGFFMRLFVIITTFIVLILFVLAVPFLIPFVLLFSVLFPKDRGKERAKQTFLREHCLDQKNKDKVAEWFELYWNEKKRAEDTFSLENLLAITPVGSDWNYGFTPTLDAYSSAVMPLPQSDFVVPREKALNQLQRELGRGYEANALLIGEDGVGKKTLLHTLHFFRYRLVELNMNKVLSRSSEISEQRTVLESLLAEAAAAGNVIVVVPEMHEYCGMYGEGDFSAVWEAAKTRIIGVTTPHYYEQYLSHHERIMKVFRPVIVEPMNTVEAEAILLRKAVGVEKQEGVHVSYEALQTILEYSDRMVTTTPYPEKAITVLYETASYVRMQNRKMVTPDDVKTALSENLRVPVGTVAKPVAGSVSMLEEQLAMHILGQDKALKEVVRVIQRGVAAEPERKPRASMLFMGPTGVGKTETAKLIAAALTGDERSMVRFDMGFYQTQAEIGEFLRLFAEGVRAHPFGVVLIDEIEKSNRAVMNVFLTLLDEGYVIDHEGQKVDCRNTFVIATSNAPSLDSFAPEFINRFDKAVTFQALSQDMACAIGLHYARSLQRDARLHGKTMEIDVEEIKKAINESFDPRFGARDVKRIVEDII